MADFPECLRQNRLPKFQKVWITQSLRLVRPPDSVIAGRCRRLTFHRRSLPGATGIRHSVPFRNASTTSNYRDAP
jgi:hypothetical protein